jgi:hypothetical protein
VHRVGQVGPVDTGVGRLDLEHLVSLVAHVARDVVGLGGAAGGVDEDDGVGAEELVVEGSVGGWVGWGGRVGEKVVGQRCGVRY